MSFTSKKVSQIKPMKTKDSEVDRVNNHIYSKLNEIIEIINTPEKKMVKEEKEGLSGTMEINKLPSGDYRLRIKTEDGWLESTNTKPTGFRLQIREDVDFVPISIDSRTVLEGDVEIQPSTIPGAAAGTDLEIHDNQSDHPGVYMDLFTQGGHAYLKTSKLGSHLVLGVNWGANITINGTQDGDITLAPPGIGKIRIGYDMISGEPTGGSFALPIKDSAGVLHYIRVRTATP